MEQAPQINNCYASNEAVLPDICIFVAIKCATLYFLLPNYI